MALNTDTASALVLKSWGSGKDCTQDLKVCNININELNITGDNVLLKINMATICGSDLHTLRGNRPAPCPIILGHEAVGTVLKSNRPGVQVGQRVTFSIFDSCGECDLCCNRELPQKCSKLIKYGHYQMTRDYPLTGCYATHILLGRGTTIAPVPPTISDKVAASINCAAATAVNAVSYLSDAAKFSNVLVQGAGLVGLYCCAMLNGRATCTEINNERRELSLKFGAKTVTKADEIVSSSYDAVIEACGQASVIQTGIRALKPGGTYILVGMVHPNSELDITGLQIIQKCLKLIGVHNYNGRHLKEAVTFVEKNQHRFPFASLLSEPFPLTRYKEGIDLALKNTFHRVAIKP